MRVQGGCVDGDDEQKIIPVGSSYDSSTTGDNCEKWPKLKT